MSRTAPVRRLTRFARWVLAVLALAGDPPARAGGAEPPSPPPARSIALAAGSVARAPAPESGSASLEPLVRRFDQERASLLQFYDLPWSEPRLARLRKFAREWQARLRQVEFARLDAQGRIDFLLLRNLLASDLDHLERETRRLEDMKALLPMRHAILELEEARRRLDPLGLEQAATAVAAIPEQIRTVQAGWAAAAPAKVEMPAPVSSLPTAATAGTILPGSSPNAAPPAPPAGPAKPGPALALRTAGAADALREALKTWYSYYEGYLPDFSWWLKKPHEEAAKALEDYAKHLREEIAGVKGAADDPLVGTPVGAAELQRELGLEMLPYTAEELIRIGETQLAWCEAERTKAAREMGCGDDWQAALEKVKTSHAPPGKQDLVVAEAAREAIAFVRQHDLVSVPPLCEETWRVSMLSADAQKTMPYVAYSRQNMLVAYAREEMKQDRKVMSMRGNNRFFTRITTAHELIPGHHLQHYAASQQREYRSLFATPFLVEGWALYCELVLWDRGYGRTPEERLGMLFWRMHRAARIVVSLQFHLGRMTPSEMVDFLVNRVGHERFGATSEVRRYIGEGISPLYQAAYLLGGLQLKALRDELAGSGRMTDREFNDAVLAFNAIPVELIRAGMLGLRLDPDSAAAWRFAGDPLPPPP